jgi:hypothetical protein
MLDRLSMMMIWHRWEWLVSVTSLVIDHRMRHDVNRVDWRCQWSIIAGRHCCAKHSTRSEAELAEHDNFVLFHISACLRATSTVRESRSDEATLTLSTYDHTCACTLHTTCIMELPAQLQTFGVKLQAQSDWLVYDG